ncbi:hypothetical protein C5167_014449 [Papaver somniferum]|uniref:Uncharacterized protein n=1 Tax=Papaver somniferum TaxID=3469 RepID=A0A4Y7J381_PAPSO|nr:hypothetical protein C5167_014449 [Papaver somniferum]
MMSEKELEEVQKFVPGRLSTAGFHVSRESQPGHGLLEVFEQISCESHPGPGVLEVFEFPTLTFSDFGDTVVGELVTNKKKLSEVSELRDGIEKAQKLLVALIKDPHKSLEDARSSASSQYKPINPPTRSSDSIHLNSIFALNL